MSSLVEVLQSSRLTLKRTSLPFMKHVLISQNRLQSKEIRKVYEDGSFIIGTRHSFPT